MTIAGTAVRNKADAALVRGASAKNETNVPAPSVDYPLGYLPALDGMRGVMTLLVIASHAGLYPKPFPGTMILMDGFFAMSGYLITSILMKDIVRNGRINFTKFYIRRLARLYPALAAMLIAFLVGAYFISADFPARLVEATISFFYIGNYWTILFGTPVPFTGHLWSLAAEEHFYLIWPIVLTLVVRQCGLSWRTTFWIIALTLAIWLVRVIAVAQGVSTPAMYVLSHFRADAFLWGCVTAMVLPRIRFDRVPWLRSILKWSLLPISIYTLVWMTQLHNWDRWYYALSPLFGAFPAIVAIGALVQPERTFMHRLYEAAPAVFCGRICYGLYVWHVPIMAPLHMTYGTKTMIFLGIPFVFVVATLSYYLIERPCMRARPL